MKLKYIIAITHKIKNILFIALTILFLSSSIYITSSLIVDARFTHIKKQLNNNKIIMIMLADKINKLENLERLENYNDKNER